MNNSIVILLTSPETNKSVIDITIIFTNLAPLCEITTESDTFGSDHFPINITIGFSCLRLLLSMSFLYKLILTIYLQGIFLARSL